MGEALGVLARGTALFSSFQSPFVHFWDYSVTVLKEPSYQKFNVTVTYKDYASGGTQKWQSHFYVILVVVFLPSCFCLVYLLWTFCLHRRVTDYTGPQNLFALAINSPPSSAMSGAYGAGPHGDLLSRKWQVDMQKTERSLRDDRQHPQFYVRCREDGFPASPRLRKKKKRSRPPNISSISISDSPAVEQYIRLSRS